MRFLLVMSFVLTFIAPAFAWSDLDRMTAATALGNLLGSEQACDLVFDQTAVAAYIDKTVPADDMEFPPMLDMMTRGTEVQVGEMTQSRKTAHCRQVERAAKANGMIK